jgi:hypothetical protein
VGVKVTASVGWLFTVGVGVESGVDVEVGADVAVDVRPVMGGIDVVGAGLAGWAHADSKPKARNMRGKKVWVFISHHF